MTLVSRAIRLETERAKAAAELEKVYAKARSIGYDIDVMRAAVSAAVKVTLESAAMGTAQRTTDEATRAAAKQIAWMELRSHK